ncbi:DNA cytosine methyltransferase [Chitinophaga silvatica]|uniref:DNA (cytosine-5-)-methyltransferase n=1 Tax=Chitinophaga silvatica TaxID=2282649 RepID=A0A3E1YAF7_9BACT|nr:DNA cytosine methyltransferase [Chitinophaga silvatica]RFS22703.1 DNA cytosine methyltransferase [Chitinophaga silvatica]
MNTIKVVSLFAGCGGLDLGFKQAGYDIIWANDFLKDACETYKKNIGDHIVHGDINTVDVNSIPQADVMIGGPPCQSFSLVGKRDPKDERSNLVWSYLKVLEHVNPKIFLFENVTGISSAKNPDGTRVIDNLVKAFEQLGYSITVNKLNAADYGVPQRRQRVFIVGNKIGKTIEKPVPTNSEEGEKLPGWVSAYDALSDLSETSETGVCKYIQSPVSEYQKLMRLATTDSYSLHVTPYASAKDKELISHIPPGGNYVNVPDSVATKRILNFKKTGGRTTTYGRLSEDKPSYTLNTHFNRLNVGCNIHYKTERLISLREGLRIQSFPDDFEVLSSNKRNYYVQIGNAVPPMLGKAWADYFKLFLSSNK